MVLNIFILKLKDNKFRNNFQLSCCIADKTATTDRDPGPLLTSTLTFLQAILKPAKHDVGTQTSISLVARKIKEIEKRLSPQEMAELQVN